MYEHTHMDVRNLCVCVCMKAQSQLPCRQVVGWCSRPAGGADRCRGSEPSCGTAAARHRGSAQWDRSGFIPACRRWRFFAEILLNLFVDKAVPELLLLDRAAEPAPGC